MCVKLYHDGDPAGSTSCYLQAQRLHSLKKSLPEKISVGPEFAWLSTDIYHLIFSTLPLPELAQCASVSRAWNKLITDNTLWMIIYCQKWPLVHPLESKISDFSSVKEQLSSGNEGILKDWYSCTKYRFFADKHFRVIFIDPGFETVKAGMIGHTFNKPVSWASSIDPNKDMVLASGQWLGRWHSSGWYDGFMQYFIGEDIKAYWGCTQQNIWEGEDIIQGLVHYINEVVVSFSSLQKEKKNFRTTHAYPLLIAVPTFLSDDMMVELISSFTELTHTAYFAFIDASLLSLYASGLSSGIVIDLGCQATRIVPIIDSKILTEYATDTFPIYGKNIMIGHDQSYSYFEPPNNLASFVHEHLKKIPQELQKQLKTIKLTGGAAGIVAPRFKGEFSKLSMFYNVFVPEDPVLDIARGAQVFASVSNAKEKFTKPKMEKIVDAFDDE